jgi:hypothetical protein
MGRLSSVFKITSLALLAFLLPGAEKEILTLSCDGTATHLISREKKKAGSNAEMVLVVDFVERTVTGLLVPARIDKSDAVHAEFSGQDDRFSVLGSIDRIGGVVRVIIAALHPTESSPFSYRWDLLCKPVKPV